MIKRLIDWFDELFDFAVDLSPEAEVIYHEDGSVSYREGGEHIGGTPHEINA